MNTQLPEASFSILMFPWLAHGHIFPYLELAKRLLNKRNFHIYLCSTPINFDSINTFLDRNKLDSRSIQLVQLDLQPSDRLPPHYHTTKNLPSSLVLDLLEALQTTKSSFSHMVATLKPDLVIYDIFQPWAAKIASSESIPAVHFSIYAAASMAFTHHHYTRPDTKNHDFPFPELCCYQDHERKNLDDLIQFLHKNIFEEDKDSIFVNNRLSSEIVLQKTCRGLEGKYVDYVSSACNKRSVPVGPLVTDARDQSDHADSDIMQWLSKRDRGSTVYISFGSECFLSDEEIGEIAKSLELCEVDFIWVMRFPVEDNKTITVEEKLPVGFQNRVKNRGIVVSGWAPQASILAHPSTGAFVSHCGWSSLTESVYYGVPVIGMPMKINMFIDAKMLADAGACVAVVREAGEVFKGEDIANVMREVMGESTGERLRRRARELSATMRSEEDRAIDEAAEELWRLCLKSEDEN